MNPFDLPASTISPVPWRHVEMAYHNKPANNSDDPHLIIHAITDGEGENVCDVFSRPDARLVVAAPELLACVLAMHKQFETGDTDDLDFGRGLRSAGLPGMFAAAIARATGVQS